MSDRSVSRPRFSVVIPAHDEATVILRCLSFVADLAPGEAQVVVVANGCRDRTIELARSVEGVRVLEIGAASKAGALNAGDDAVTAFPRVYLDADIVVSAASLRLTVDALADPAVFAAAPTAHFETARSSTPVRAFYRAYRKMPYLSDSMLGTGLYALSQEGRARFDRFPDLTADDLFVQRLFDPGQRRVVSSGEFAVQAPRDLRSLVAVRGRVASGNRQLAGAAVGDAAGGSSGRASLVALLHLTRTHQVRSGDAAVYVAVTVAARLKARTTGRAGLSTWARDESTRT